MPNNIDILNIVLYNVAINFNERANMLRRFKTDILVRNNRIEQMQNQGLTVDYRILSDEEYREELNRKLIEESNEVIAASGLDDLSSEIGDVLEVIDAMVELYGLDMDKIQQKKLKKQKKIGKFDKKYKTNWVEADDSNDVVEYYLARPEKYPEIKSNY